jgi:NAD(P)-dependent dehydrogenase (short-subunit alcohol dehydrogenase family)
MKALVTGASRGLGQALAAGLAREGYGLVADARDAGALAAAGLDMAIQTGGNRPPRPPRQTGGNRPPRPPRQTGGNRPPGPPRLIPGDVTDPGHREALRQAAGEDLDLLVNNAGTLGAAPLPALTDYPLEDLRTAFEVNVIAPIALTQLLLPTLRRRGGAVLNITSDAAVEAYAGWGGYGAVKAALEQASNVLAAEELTIRVWWVDPGDLRTDMHQQAFPGEDISDRPLPAAIVPAFIKLITERLPSGRYRASDLL